MTQPILHNDALIGTSIKLNTDTIRAILTGAVDVATLGSGFNSILVAPSLSVAAGGIIVPKGNWTPTDASGAGLGFSAAGTFEKIDRLVIARAIVAFPATADGTPVIIGGLPYTVANTEEARQGVVSYTDAATAKMALVNKNTANILIYNLGGGNAINSSLSAKTLYLTAIYHT